MAEHNELIVKAILDRINGGTESLGIPLGVSNKHIHLTQDAMDTLFGAGYELTKLKDLSQPGQFAAVETVCIAGRKGCFSNVRVLGPVRKDNQVEISRTDAFALGVTPPVRISGDLEGAADICVIGPKGMAVLRGSVIVAQAHIHMTPDDAAKHQVQDGELVSVEISGDRRCTIHDVVIRVSEASALEFHLDTDEANAAGVRSGQLVRIKR